jgi:hypothetical protein
LKMPSMERLYHESVDTQCAEMRIVPGWKQNCASCLESQGEFVEICA